MFPEVVKKREGLGGQLGWKQCDLAAQHSLLDYGSDANFFDLGDLRR